MTDFVALKRSADMLLDYLETRPMGESFWVDEEGNYHTADIGYVYEFLNDFCNYCGGKA